VKLYELRIVIQSRWRTLASAGAAFFSHSYSRLLQDVQGNKLILKIKNKMVQKPCEPEHCIALTHHKLGLFTL
jgi:hypothetical protein